MILTTCPECAGSGYAATTIACHMCDGTGNVFEMAENLDVPDDHFVWDDEY